MTAIRVSTESGGVYEITDDGRYRKVVTTDESFIREFDWDDYEEISARLTGTDDNFEQLESISEVTAGNQLYFFRNPYEWRRTSGVIKVEVIK
jgi:hypothetical protein